MSREDILMPSLQQFFNDDCHFELLRDLINPSKARVKKLSLGLLDWFNVNYSKNYGIVYPIKKVDGKVDIFDVWRGYNAALNGYSKECFDPFGRGKSKGNIVTLEKNGDYVTTTVRQLNYLRWAIRNLVIDYIVNHIDEIYDDMNRRSNRGKKSVVKNKKKQLSVSASRTLGIRNVKMTVEFKTAE